MRAGISDGSPRAAEERSRLAREIHDTLAQGLAGIALQRVKNGKIVEEKFYYNN